MYERPRRRWANFSEYRVWLFVQCSYFFRKYHGAYPCTRCEGRGTVVDPSTLGIYETRAEYIKCGKCEGKQTGSEADHRQVYREETADFQAKAKEYARQLKHFRSAKAKLTPDELAALGKFGVNFKPASRKCSATRSN